MSSIKEFDTEKRIFEAAQLVFLQKGLVNTTMQDIASKAGISRTSLHYYFRNKDTLFESILSMAMDNMMPKINQTISKDIPLVEKIIEFAYNYLDLLHDNDQLPGFMASEIRRNPDKVIGFILKNSTTINFDIIEKQMEEEVKAGKVRPFNLSQLVVTVAGLCIFPFICKPVLENVLESDGSNFDSFIIERRTVIAEIITNWLYL
ncbi:MAG: TetR/AcrR family transcriptional regulator [Paludibacteraceae bacterium]|nr:TetR/AcrR family transcriptional regulator [Paludibacteraceae bacterium]